MLIVQDYVYKEDVRLLSCGILKPCCSASVELVKVTLDLGLPICEGDGGTNAGEVITISGKESSLRADNLNVCNNNLLSVNRF